MKVVYVISVVIGALLWASCSATWGTDHFTLHPIGTAAYAFPGATNGIPGHE